MNQLFRRCAVFALAAGTLYAVDWKALKPEGYVSDFARVVDPQSKAALEQYCAAVQTSTGAQIALVTLPSLQGEPVEDVANTIFHAWGVGSKGKNDGIMLLLSVGDRRSRLEVGYGLEGIIPDGFAGSILDEMRPALRQQHYGEAMMAAAQTVGSTIAKSKGTTINAQLPRHIYRHVADSILWPVVAFGLFIFVFLVIAGFAGSALLSGLFMGNMMGRSTFGSQSGGGFGGYDSGDSFGGFGGGDSGGGGASSDW